MKLKSKSILVDKYESHIHFNNFLQHTVCILYLKNMKIPSHLRRDFYPSKMIIGVLINRSYPILAVRLQGQSNPLLPLLLISIAIPHHRCGQQGCGLFGKPRSARIDLVCYIWGDVGSCCKNLASWPETSLPLRWCPEAVRETTNPDCCQDGKQLPNLNITFSIPHRTPYYPEYYTKNIIPNYSKSSSSLMKIIANMHEHDTSEIK